MKLSYIVKSDEHFDNIKEVLKTKFEISDRLLLKLKKNNLIFLNNTIANIFSLCYNEFIKDEFSDINL